MLAPPFQFLRWRVVAPTHLKHPASNTLQRASPVKSPSRDSPLSRQYSFGCSPYPSPGYASDELPWGTHAQPDLPSSRPTWGLRLWVRAAKNPHAVVCKVSGGGGVRARTTLLLRKPSFAVPRAGWQKQLEPSQKTNGRPNKGNNNNNNNIIINNNNIIINNNNNTNNNNNNATETTTTSSSSSTTTTTRTKTAITITPTTTTSSSSSYSSYSSSTTTTIMTTTTTTTTETRRTTTTPPPPPPPPTNTNTSTNNSNNSISSTKNNNLRRQ